MKISISVKSWLIAAVAAISLPAVAEDMTDGFYNGAASYSIGKDTSFTLNSDGYKVLKVSLSKGGDYTFVTKVGEGDETVSIDVDYIYSEDGDKTSGTLISSEQDEYSATTERAIIQYQDWIDAWIIPDPEDDEPMVYKPSGYFVVLIGNAGQTVTLGSAKSVVREAVPPGTRGNPAVLSSITKKGTSKTGQVQAEGSCFFKATLTKDRCYKFTVTGGTDYNVEPVSESVEDPRVVDLKTTSDTVREFKVYPTQTGSYYIEVSGEADSAVTLSAVLIDARAIAEHPTTDLTVGASVKCHAGARNDSEGMFVDNIIDTSLFKIASLKAHETVVFETKFKENFNGVMEIYDSTGAMVARNWVNKNWDAENNVGGQLIAFTPSKLGDYYVGVCNDDVDLDEVEERPDTIEGTLSVHSLGVIEGERDDDYLGASTMSFVLGNAETEGAKQWKYDAAGNKVERGFTESNHVDWFVIGATKDITYNISAKSAEGNYSPLRPMNVSLWKLNKGAMVPATAIEGDADLGDPEATGGVAFTATANGTIYLKVELQDGAGVEYPYEIFAWVDASNYGKLLVNLHGASEAEWSIKGQTGTYAGGSELIVKAGQYTIVPGKATGWTVPSGETVNVPAGNDGIVKDFMYSDTSDHKDDVASGAVAMSGSYAKPFFASRSLWVKGSDGKDDPADWFKLSVKVGTVYEFAVVSSEGEAEAYVYRTNAGDNANLLASGKTFNLVANENGNYFVKVVRSASFAKVNTAYTITMRPVAVGQIKADKNAYSVKDNAGELAVKLSRTGKEGRVRVRYTTIEDTAKAEIDYIAAKGEIVWEDGDSAAKTLVIKILPDLINRWTGDREFSILLDSVEDAEFDSTSEYRPNLVAGKLSVTITDANKAVSGTIQPVAWGDEVADFENEKKPAFTVDAGNDAILWLSRDDGSDLSVGAKIAITAKQTAGQEFVEVDEQEIWWADGDAENKKVIIPTSRPTDDWFANQTFTVKITALAGDGKPTVKNGSVTVTVRDGNQTRSIADYSASFDKASGVTIKPTGNWYFDEMDSLRSANVAAKGKSSLTYTFNGPGRLSFTPEFINGDGAGSTCTCTIGKKNFVCDGSSYTEYIEATGKTTLTITLTRAANAAADAETYVALLPQANGEPFYWEPLTLPELIQPALGEKQLFAGTNTRIIWTNPVGNEVFLVYCDKDKKMMGNKAAFISPNRSENDGNPLATYVYPHNTSSYFCTSCAGWVEGFEPNTTYYVRVDSAFVDDDNNILLRNENKKVWTFRTAAANTPIVEAIDKGFVDADGLSIVEKINNREVVELIQGVNVTNLVFGVRDDEDDEKFRTDCTYQLVAGSKLPNGLKFDKNGFFTGAPQKTGEYIAVVQAMDAKKAVGATVAVKLNVKSLELAVGSFSGLLDTTDAEITDSAALMAQQLGSINVTVKDTGSISADVKLGAAKYTFKKDAYDGISTYGDGSLSSAYAVMDNVFTLKTSDGKSHSCTNSLNIVACRESLDDAEARGQPMNVTMKLMTLSDDKSEVIEAVYNGIAIRDNSKIAEAAAEMKPFDGYYVTSLAVSEAFEGAPAGSGYLLVTLTSSKANAKFTGVLGDGTAISGTSSMCYIIDDGNGASAIRIPIYFNKGTITFSGWLMLKQWDLEQCTLDGQDIMPGVEGIVVADSSESLFTWVDANPNAAWDGVTSDGWSGFVQGVSAVGGYYSTVVNLQAYYRDYSLYLVDFAETDQLPDELKGETYDYVAYPGMIYDEESRALSGLYFDMKVNELKVDATTLEYKLDEKGKKTKLIDWASSVNPCRFTFAFKQATGVFSGTMEIYSGDEEGTVQNKLGSFKHAGVMPLSRDLTSGFGFDNATLMGYYLAPVKKTVSGKSVNWNMSYNLFVGSEKREPAVEEMNK